MRRIRGLTRKRLQVTSHIRRITDEVIADWRGGDGMTRGMIESTVTLLYFFDHERFWDETYSERVAEFTQQLAEEEARRNAAPASPREPSPR